MLYRQTKIGRTTYKYRMNLFSVLKTVCDIQIKKMSQFLSQLSEAKIRIIYKTIYKSIQA